MIKLMFNTSREYDGYLNYLLELRGEGLFLFLLGGGGASEQIELRAGRQQALELLVLERLIDEGHQARWRYHLHLGHKS